MPTWLRLSIGVLAIAGGLLGLWPLVKVWMDTPLSAGQHAFFALVALYYAVAAAGGLLLVIRHPRAIGINLVVWGLQMPAIATASVSFMLAVGAFLAVGVRGFGLGVHFYLGSMFELAWDPASDAAGLFIGVNVVALVVVLLLWRYRLVRPAHSR